jgi:hypothetical protein
MSARAGRISPATKPQDRSTAARFRIGIIADPSLDDPAKRLNVDACVDSDVPSNRQLDLNPPFDSLRSRAPAIKAPIQPALLSRSQM